MRVGCPASFPSQIRSGRNAGIYQSLLNECVVTRCPLAFTPSVQQYQQLTRWCKRSVERATGAFSGNLLNVSEMNTVCPKLELWNVLGTREFLPLSTCSSVNGKQTPIASPRLVTVNVKQSDYPSLSQHTIRPHWRPGGILIIYLFIYF